MEGADGSGIGERTGLVGAMQEDCKAIRGHIWATHAMAVPIIGGEAMNVYGADSSWDQHYGAHPSKSTKEDIQHSIN